MYYIKFDGIYGLEILCSNCIIQFYTRTESLCISRMGDFDDIVIGNLSDPEKVLNKLLKRISTLEAKIINGSFPVNVPEYGSWVTIEKPVIKGEELIIDLNVIIDEVKNEKNI